MRRPEASIDQCPTSFLPPSMGAAVPPGAKVTVISWFDHEPQSTSVRGREAPSVAGGHRIHRFFMTSAKADVVARASARATGAWLRRALITLSTVCCGPPGPSEALGRASAPG
jgi:hypothetical protein